MLNSLIRTHRERLGLTQSKLSVLSGISLPTIQNIEAKRANPEMETVQKLLHALGLETFYAERKADWDFLSLCGVPLLKLNALDVLCTKSRFIEEMRLALLECEHSNEDRKLKAMGATLLALFTHYPAVYKEFAHCAIAKTLSKRDDLLKLRRVALQSLVQFL